jgi:lysophospholipase L1-like esterase
MADRRVLFFGDSLVAGVGDPSGRGWVGRVVEASFAAGVPVTAYNLGVRAETSVQVASRWRQETGPRISPAADIRIVLSFGANDTTIEGGQERVDPESSRGALETILDRAAMVGLAVLVVGPAPVDEDEQNGRIQALSRAFGEVCAERGLPFVSVIDPLLANRLWMKQVAAGDGAHPGADGYDALARSVLEGGWLDWLRADAT